MEISVVTRDRVTTVQLEGSFIGGKDSIDFADAIGKCLDAGQLLLIIDLSRTDFMNSAGLGSLFAGYGAVNKAGGKMILAGCQSRVAELLSLTKADTVLTVCGTVEEADRRFA